MQMRQLIGAQAGQVLDFPYHVAKAGIEARTMCALGDEPVIRGMVWDPPLGAVAGEKSAPPVVAPSTKKPKRRRAKRKMFAKNGR